MEREMQTRGRAMGITLEQAEKARGQEREKALQEFWIIAGQAVESIEPGTLFMPLAIEALSWVVTDSQK